MKTILAIILLAATAQAATLTIEWEDNSDNEDAFYIERKPVGGEFATIATVGADVTTYSDPAVEVNIQYTYRVRAGNSSGPSGYTNEATGKVQWPPKVVTPTPIIGPSSPTQANIQI